MPIIVLTQEDVIASRAYMVGHEGPIVFTAQLGRPEKLGPGNFKCVYVLAGRYQEWSGWAVGIDGFDAIDSAMRMLGSTIGTLSERYFNSELTWEVGSQERPLGLPMIDEHTIV